MASDPAGEVGACERHEDYRKTRRRKKSANKHFPTPSQLAAQLGSNTGEEGDMNMGYGEIGGQHLYRSGRR